MLIILLHRLRSDAGGEQGTTRSRYSCTTQPLRVVATAVRVRPSYRQSRDAFRLNPHLNETL